MSFVVQHIPIPFILALALSLATLMKRGKLTSQIFALGKSTVGTNAESTVYARNVPVSIAGVQVSPVSHTPF